jgi:predicted HicB family RNase H-like nuclease
MPRSTVNLQARVPRPLAERVQAAAATSGKRVNAYIRDLLVALHG